MNFVVNNQEMFETHSSIHSVNIRNTHHLNRTNVTPSCVQESAFYAGTKIFSSAPFSIVRVGIKGTI
jgi:hypothetical protein